MKNMFLLNRMEDKFRPTPMGLSSIAVKIPKAGS